MAQDIEKLKAEINVLFNEIGTLQITLDDVNIAVRDAYAEAEIVKKSIDDKKKQLAQRMRIAGFLLEE